VFFQHSLSDKEKRKMFTRNQQFAAAFGFISQAIALLGKECPVTATLAEANTKLSALMTDVPTETPTEQHKPAPKVEVKPQAVAPEVKAPAKPAEVKNPATIDLSKFVKPSVTQPTPQSTPQSTPKPAPTAQHAAPAKTDSITIAFGTEQGFQSVQYIQPEGGLGWAYKAYRYTAGPAENILFTPKDYIDARRHQPKSTTKKLSDIGVVNRNAKSGAYSVRISEAYRINFIWVEPKEK
jgi:hypothetical protein